MCALDTHPIKQHWLDTQDFLQKLVKGDSRELAVARAEKAAAVTAKATKTAKVAAARNAMVVQEEAVEVARNVMVVQEEPEAAARNAVVVQEEPVAAARNAMVVQEGAVAAAVGSAAGKEEAAAAAPPYAGSIETVESGEVEMREAAAGSSKAAALPPSSVRAAAAAAARAAAGGAKGAALGETEGQEVGGQDYGSMEDGFARLAGLNDDFLGGMDRVRGLPAEQITDDIEDIFPHSPLASPRTLFSVDAAEVQQNGIRGHHVQHTDKQCQQDRTGQQHQEQQHSVQPSRSRSPLQLSYEEEGMDVNERPPQQQQQKQQGRTAPPSSPSNHLNLEWMRSATDEEASNYLLGVEGLGSKSTGCVNRVCALDKVCVSMHVRTGTRCFCPV